MQIANMLTSDYFNMLKNDQVSLEYKSCLAEFVDGILTSNCENIETVLLYGGLVRDRKSFDEWSDIDIVVVFKDITKRNTVKLAELLRKLERKYFIRIDLTQISFSELTDPRLSKYCVNSELINAISMRENVTIVVFGQLPCSGVDMGQERQAAAFYITNTLGNFRRYIVEVLYRDDSEEHIRVGLRRITRWVFSIVRASLRLFDIFTHPYEHCLPYLRHLFPGQDFSLLKQLIEIREDINNTDITLMREIIPQIELFIEKYVELALRRYANEIERAK